jgi:hypothetical protein
MSDALERELRSVLAEQALTLPPGARERLEQLDYKPNSSRWPRLTRVSAVAGAAAGGLVALGTTVALLLSSGGLPAGGGSFALFAQTGWTASPRTPSAADVARAKAICEGMKGAAPGLTAPLAGRLVLSEQRGRYVAALYDRGHSTGLCISTGQKNGASMGADSNVAALDHRPAATRIGLPSLSGEMTPGLPGVKHGSLTMSRHITHLQTEFPHLTVRQCMTLNAAEQRAASADFATNGYGRAGRDVTGVTFIFARGRDVQATVENGWYFGWWPRDAWPVSLRVTSTSGTKLQPIPGALAASRQKASAYCDHFVASPSPATARLRKRH